MFILILLGFLVEIIITAISLVLPVMLFRAAWNTGQSWLIAGSLGVGLYLFAVTSCLVCVTVYRFLPKTQPGTYDLIKDSQEFWKFVIAWHLRLYILKTPAAWTTRLPGGKPFLRIAGSKLGERVNGPCFDHILDFHSVDIGDNVILGYNSVLSGHMGKKNNGFIVGEIKIEDNALIGVNAFVWPDVTIGKRAVVMPGAVVYPGTRIKEDEVWGGNPAVKIEKKVKSD
ncbi:DapH/DapD/GlmU-related protein [Gloeocapsa sp. PCC 73106]|uniref:DapH/DapD/GlmU-related protein n=1 Tax=Gloeocapsa sp. PCC 73106 TaxID=102232 RepID=UPI0002AC3BE0|nr:DapH/DapD/GlmU-related protein [Gloeocapsa sp. PCC 73106]ELR99704.1 hypothetical protein GLO73106DRAFT_00035560 [Gloeocapsa sp. PCC 73106]